jgi:hypothetical protein
MVLLFKKISFLACNIYGFFGALCGFASISTTVFISIERLLVLKCPFNNLTSNKLFKICN